MKPDHKTLAEIGEALFGLQWQSDMARSLEVSIRTMQRWAGGNYDIPESVWRDIARLCLERGSALTQWAARIMK